MIEHVGGWIVRTHDGVQERFWRVAVPEKGIAEEIAASLAHAGAQAVTPFTSNIGRSTRALKFGGALEIKAFRPEPTTYRPQ